MPSSTTRSETISLSTLRGEVSYDPTNLFRLNQNIPPKAS
jgi:Berberine and berberine like